MKLKDITEAEINDIADSSIILARGLDYYETRRVVSLSFEGETIAAKVKGSHGIYDVEVSADDGEIQADCDCPYDGYGCKHIVAVLYKWLAEKNKGTKVKLTKIKKHDFSMEKTLSKLDKTELLKILLQLSQKYEDVNRDLSIKLSSNTGASIHAQGILLKQIKDAFYDSDGFSYDEMFDAVRKLEEIQKAILGTPPKVKTELLRVLISRSRKSYEVSDDSSGSFGEFIVDCLAELGKSLREQNLPFNEKRKIMQENFDAIRKEQYGLEEGYVKLLLEIPSTKKDFDFLISELKSSSTKQKEDYEREMYRDMLTELYKKAGKDSEYIALLEENAKKEGEYLPIAEYWKEEGDVKKALEVAEKGINAEKEWSNEELYEFLENVYQAQKDNKNLLRILELHFEESPSLLKYKKTAKVAMKLNQWEKIKKQLIRQAKGQTLIEIYLLENELEKAFEQLANARFQYSERFMDKVAAALREKYPEKALKIYYPIVKQFIAMAQRDTYRVAALYAKKIKEIYTKLKQERKWEDYIEGIREQNRHRHALIEEFGKL